MMSCRHLVITSETALDRI